MAETITLSGGSASSGVGSEGRNSSNIYVRLYFRQGKSSMPGKVRLQVRTYFYYPAYDAASNASLNIWLGSSSSGTKLLSRTWTWVRKTSGDKTEYSQWFDLPEQNNTSSLNIYTVCSPVDGYPEVTNTITISGIKRAYSLAVNIDDYQIVAQSSDISARNNITYSVQIAKEIDKEKETGKACFAGRLHIEWPESSLSGPDRYAINRFDIWAGSNSSGTKLLSVVPDWDRLPAAGSYDTEWFELSPISKQSSYNLFCIVRADGAAGTDRELSFSFAEPELITVNGTVQSCTYSIVDNSRINNGNRTNQNSRLSIIYDTDSVTWTAKAKSGHKLNQDSGSFTVSGRNASIQLYSLALATIHAFVNGVWQLFSIYIMRNGQWVQHQANVFKDGSWQQYS